MGFCFAPRFHPAMRFAGPTRRELGVPTAFNYLGPVANPARVRRLLLGVGDPAMAEPMLDVLVSRGAERAMVVFGDDGMDELTTTTTSTVLELADGQRQRWTLDPAQLGLAPATREALAVSGPQDSAAAARRVLAGEHGPHRDIVALNAAGALIVSGLAGLLRGGPGPGGAVAGLGSRRRRARRAGPRLQRRLTPRALAGSCQRRQERGFDASELVVRAGQVVDPLGQAAQAVLLGRFAPGGNRGGARPGQIGQADRRRLDRGRRGGEGRQPPTAVRAG